MKVDGAAERTAAGTAPALEDFLKPEWPILSGTEAAARGAWEAGVQVAAGYPGAPVTGVLAACGDYAEVGTQWAVNEKIALEIAIGVAYSGRRSLAVMKHVGLNVAADSLYNLAYTGLKGGLVLVVGDDPGAKSSQNEQDTRMVARAAGVPVLEPSCVQEVLDFTRLAFELSEAYDLPVIVRLVSQLAFMYEKVRIGERRAADRPMGFATPLSKYLLIPAFVLERHREREAHLSALADGPEAAQCNALELPEGEGDDGRFPLGVIAAGHPACIAVEAFGAAAPVLRLGLVHPLPARAIRDFAARCDRLVVADEASDYLDREVRALGIHTLPKPAFDPAGAFRPEFLLSPEAPELARAWEAVRRDTRAAVKPLPVEKRVPGFCAGCPHTAVFHVLRGLKVNVVGDIGCSTLGALEPYGALHSNLCMGASIGVMHGYLSAMGPEARKRTVAVLGDSTFFHSGMPALLTLAHQKSPGTVILLDNAGSAMTGLQSTSPSFPAESWLSLIRAFGIADVKVIDALDVAALQGEVLECLAAEGLSVRVLKGKCVQEEPRPKERSIYRYVVNQDACTACGVCLDTNCPSFEVAGGVPADARPVISISSACVGCGFCQQVCPEGAILPLSVTKAVGWAPPLLRLFGKVRWYRLIRRLRAVKTFDRFFDALEDILLKRRHKSPRQPKTTRGKEST